MNEDLADALSKASHRQLVDLAAFLTSKFEIQSLDPETGTCADVDEDGIVMALHDWAALHGGKPVGKD
ncbi:hypothetical protein KX928_08970 [Roseobacter sp. YSTF-M11]|uniref:Uncharacterized protein n=1 Tax=Roseobacter insulae TaxID=2859783 RepID=A0A9X1FUF3_9RHOB|nr:hypothetical protein [Roseobacter insulae]MBW4707916.1 hypothetical protein [Roseobacter insulae]